MKANPICRVCKVVLNEENWYTSSQRDNRRICKKCTVERAGLWQKANPDKHRAINTKASRKRGVQPMSENKECSQFLGVHIAERVLSHVFRDVERMHLHNHGFDFICNHGKLIEVKSSCSWKNGVWGFHINRNTIADYFLCLAFDNREDLNPLHAWLIPGNKLSHLTTASISPSTISRWDAYRLDISKISECCDTLKAG